VTAVLRRCRGCAREYGAGAGPHRCEDCGYEIGWWCTAHETWLPAPKEWTLGSRLVSAVWDLPNRGVPTCARCEEDARLAKERRRVEAERARVARERAKAARKRKRKKPARPAPRVPRSRRAKVVRLVLALSIIGVVLAGGYCTYLRWLSSSDHRPRVTVHPAPPDQGTRSPVKSIERMAVGGHLMRARRYREAVEVFQRAIELDPENAWAHCGLSGALYKRRRYRESESAAREAIRLAERGEGKLLGSSHFALGRALAAQRRRQAAIGELRRALRYHPRHTAARRLLRRLASTR
jgi:tetratricopeptide (TPR) repeat protein